MSQWVKRNKAFFILFVIISFVYFSSLLYSHDIWWDSSVYLGMGKYIYSFGNSGLWEASRPILWPLILGLFWKLGLDAFLFGKITVIIFSLGVVFLTYIIASILFGRKTALIASFFLALSQTFFMFTGIMHAEIPSAFFAMLGFYFFIQKKCNYAGMLIGIAFMARFFQIFFALALFLLLLYLTAKKKETAKALLNFSVFFFIPVIPYLVLNYMLYNNAIYPFFLQAFMTKYTGFIFDQPFYFYIVSLMKENFLIVFSVLGLALCFRKYDFGKYAMALFFLLGFVPYNLAMHKEMRLLIPVLPFLYILAAYGLVYFTNILKKKAYLALFSLLAVFLALSLPDLSFDSYDGNLDVFYTYMNEIKENDGIWISNPAFIAYSDKKADELIYYPSYDSRKIDELENNIGKANAVLIDTCDLICAPYDKSCSQKNYGFMDLLRENFLMFKLEERGLCSHYIFEKVYN